jgi:hypothetical protein
MDPRTVLAAVAIVVSVTTFGLSFWFNWRGAVAGRRPVLVFDYDGSVGWAVRNIGNGPALNVIIAQKRVGGEWFNPVRVPPLAKDVTMVLPWLGHVNTTGLGATYTDYDERDYTSTCGHDLSHSTRGRGFGPWPEAQIGRHWNQPMYVE